MKLSECMIGVVVKVKDGIELYRDVKMKNPVGHIMYFSTNINQEVIPVIRWASGVESPVHKDSLELVKD